MGVRVIISTSGEACSPPVPPAPVPSYNPSGYPWYQIGEGCPGQPPVAGLIIGRHRVIIATGGLDGCTGGDGTVTSVGLDLPSEFVVTGSPITGSGTFIVSKTDQSANLVYASPAGISGQPIFRALVPTDLPVATASSLGVVKPDDSTITISDGVITAVGGGIDQLTGDVTAGPGTGSQATTLKTVNSNVGSYTNANITVNAKGLITAAASGSGGGSGTVSSVAMTVPSFLSVSGSPVTTSGTLAVGLQTQSANKFFAGPASGSAATPTFRSLVSADLPTGIGTVSSVAVAVPSWQTVSGSPVTSSGTITISDNSQSANLVFSGPSSGSAAAPTFRAIAVADLPVATSSTLGIVQPDNSTITISGGVISSIASGGVTSVALTVPSWQTVSGSPVTSTGTLAISDNTQNANLLFAGPSSGSAAAPTFRSLVSTDVPLLTVGFVMNSGITGTNVGAMLVSPRAGSVTKCVIVTKTSDLSTALTFRIKQNGTDVFSSDPTVAAGTASGTVTTTTSLTSSPLSVAVNDVFSIDVTSGTANWAFTAQLQ